MATPTKKYICHSYIPGGNLKPEQVSKIDFNKITHTNIAFSILEPNEQGLYVPTITDSVRAGIALVLDEIKRQGADSKVLISIGGWAASFFCEAASNDQSRKAFADKCLVLLEETGIQGIDIDWEYPGFDGGGIISACKNCKTDFIALCKAVRKAIGKDYLLTVAVGSHLSRDLDYSQLNDDFDYINVMTYDMAKINHSSFFRSTFSMRFWARSGFDKSKLVFGIPFYARSRKPEYSGKGYNELMALVKEGKAKLKNSKNQDLVILADGECLGIDTPNSIARKGTWVKKHGFGGLFNWQELTDVDGELRAAMYKSLYE